jgi:hypothetical protein
MVTERLPAEQEQLGDNQIMNHGCLPSSQDTDACPNTCQGSPTDEVLAAAVAPVDYDRYCTYKCKPTLTTPGTACVRLTMEEQQQAETKDGNGRSGGFPSPLVRLSIETGLPIPANTTLPPLGVAAGPEGAGDSEAPWERAVEEQEREEERRAAAEVERDMVTREVGFDLRKLIYERLRSESGAAMARGAATSQRVNVNDHNIRRKNALLREVKKAIEPVEQGLDVSRAAAMNSAANATEAAGAAGRALRLAEESAAQVVPATINLTMYVVNQEAQQAADEEAQAYGERFGWNSAFSDPASNARIAGNKAAQPYLEQMVTMGLRMQQYTAAADDLMKQAVTTEEEAKSEVPQADAMEAHGDSMGAVTERHKIQSFLNRAEEVRAEAQKYRLVAEEAREAIPKWQQAGYQAAVHAAESYRLSLSTPAPSY